MVSIDFRARRGVGEAQPARDGEFEYQIKSLDGGANASFLNL